MTKQSDILKLQKESELNAEKQNNCNYSEEEFKPTKIVEVEETPFVLIKNPKTEEYHIAVGNEVASKETFKTQKEAKIYINQKPWELIITAGLIINNKINKK